MVDFHDDPDMRILFASDAGGVGLNLQHAASCCINIELPWNPAVLEQRIGRIYRLGQKRPIDVYNLVSQGCIESRIATLVSEKQALFSGLFDGDRDEIRFESSGSFLDSVERIVQPVDVPAPAADADEVESAESGVEREVDEVLASADESTDPLWTDPGSARADGASPPSAVAAPAAEGIRALFDQLEIQRTEQGGLRIEAPPEAAAGLASFFEGMAELMRKAVQ